MCNLPNSIEFGKPLITKFGEFSAKCLQVDSSLSSYKSSACKLTTTIICILTMTLHY